MDSGEKTAFACGALRAQKIMGYHVDVCEDFIRSQTLASGHQAELEKSIVFNGYFQENCENLLNVNTSSKKNGEFLNFLGFSKNFPYIFLIFLNFLEHSRKIKGIKNIR